MTDAPHIPIVHDSPEWHALRARNIGSSEVGGLFDLPANQRPAYMLTRYALWHVKRGVTAPPVDRERTKWGLMLEEAIATGAAEQENWVVTKGGYVHDETTPGLACTLDYVIAGDPAEEGKGALELKNVDGMIHRKSWLDEEPPLHILLQLQHQLAATGYAWGAVAGLVGGNTLHIYRYKRRPKIIAEIRRCVTEFWDSIRENREPEVDGSSGSSAILRALYADPDEQIADLTDRDEEFTRWAQEFLDASADRQEAERRRDEAENHLLAMLGNHQVGRGARYQARLSIGKDTPDRPAVPGEIIKGRRGARVLRVKEV